MTGTSCCVQVCHNNTKYSRNVSWHKFPSNTNLRRAWLRHLTGNKRRFVPTRHSKICGAHFNKSGIKLMTDHIPKFLLGKRMLIGKKNPDDPLVGPMRPLTRSTAAPWESCDVLEEHNYSISKQTATRLQTTVEYICPLCEDLQEQVKALKQLISLKDRQISKLSSRSPRSPSSYVMVDRRELQLKWLQLKWAYFAKNPAAFEFFTGFENAQQFHRLLEYVKPAYSAVRATKSVNSIHFQTLLPLGVQLFLVLCRLRLGYNDKDIAENFNISNAVYDRMWEFWLNILYEQLVVIRIWARRRPGERRTAILDCTKICGSAKCLLAVRPDGMVCFVSDLYPPELGEVEITKRCGILDLLGSGDRVVVDGGFAIQGLLMDRQIVWCRPTSLKRKWSLLEDVSPTRGAIERVMKNLKRFKILVTTNGPWTLKVWKICCHLLNFKRTDFEPKKSY